MKESNVLNKLKTRIKTYEEMIVKVKVLLGSSDGDISENDQKK